MATTPSLTPQELAIMKVVWRLGSATVRDVHDVLRREHRDDLAYTTVLTMMRILEQKGHVRHEEEGRAYVYLPAVRRDAARQHALSHLLKTFFDNSAEQAVAALLAIKGEKMSEGELDRMSRLIDAAKKGTRGPKLLELINSGKLPQAEGLVHKASLKAESEGSRSNG